MRDTKRYTRLSATAGRLACRSMIAAMIVLPGLALASATAGADAGRYELRQTGPGEFVRLDTLTGNVSTCRNAHGNWICKSAADDRQAYRAEIAELTEQNRQLRLKVKTLEKNLAKKDEGMRLRLPNDAEIEGMMSFFRKMFDKLMDLARELDKTGGERA